MNRPIKRYPLSNKDMSPDHKKFVFSENAVIGT